MSRKKPKPTKEELERLYLEERISLCKISEEFGVSDNTIRNCMDEHRIDRRSQSEAHLPEGFEKPSKEELKRLYNEEMMSARKIAKEYGVGKMTILRLMKGYGIDRRSLSEAMLPAEFEKPSKEELKRLYLEERMSLSKIAEVYGVSDNTIRNCMDEYGIDRRNQSEAHLPEGFEKPSKEELKRLYLEEYMSTPKIAKEYGVSECVIYKCMDEYGIDRRNQSEAHLPEGFEKPSKEELERMFYEERINISKIARKYGVGDSTIRRWIERFNIGNESGEDELESLLEKYVGGSQDDK